jgi:hypothetical protein
MKAREKLWFVGVLVLFIGMFSQDSNHVSAQAPIQLSCGQRVDSVFTEDLQTHDYIIEANSEMQLQLYAEVTTGNYEILGIDIGLWAPNNFEIDNIFLEEGGATSTVLTDWLSVDGTYNIHVRGWTNTGGGYFLAANCLYRDGRVVTATNVIQSANCGSIIQNTITRDLETHRYYLVLNQNDQVKFTASTLSGNYESLGIDIGLWAPNNFEIDNIFLGEGGANSIIETAELSITGIYRLEVRGWTTTGGNYELAITCTLANGTVINPGDIPPVTTVANTNQSADTTSTNQTAPQAPTFSGRGFPGLTPVDFSQGAILTLTLGGTPNSGQISDGFVGIFGYTFSANAGDQFVLNFTRQSGNLNLGIAVITSNNVVVFESSLMSSSILITQFTLPVTGEYTIGVYRSSLQQPTDAQATSFQITGTINP